MIRKNIKRVIKKLLGTKPPPPTPQKRYEPPPPPDWLNQESEHSHEHSHGHSHGHDHNHEPEPVITEQPHEHSHEHAQPPENEIEILAIETPNPNAYKFSISKKITEKSFSASSKKEAKGHPLAEALLAHEHISSIFGVNDFVTVTKNSDAEWNALIPDIIQIIQKNV